MQPSTPDLWKNLAFAAVYFVTAQLGLMLEPGPGENVLLWAPAGISLCALLVYGVWLWPGLALGSFLVSLAMGLDPLAGAVITVGITLESVAGARVLKYLGLHRSLDRLRDVVALALIGAAASPMISATFGIAGLWFAGRVPASLLGTTWLEWWWSGVVSVLLIAPVLLTWSVRFPRCEVAESRRRFEVVALGVVLVLVALTVFYGGYPAWLHQFRRSYVIFPLLIWSGIRFGPRGAVHANAVVALIALSATVLGLGPFARNSIHESFMDLQSFLATTALTTLMLGAISVERSREAALDRQTGVHKGAILEAALDGVVTLDKQGRILEFNSSAERLFGFHRGEVMGKELAQLLLGPQLRDSFRRGLTENLLTGDPRVLGERVKCPALRRDQTQFPAEIGIVRVAVEGPPLFTAFIRDITAQQQSRELLEQKVQERTANLLQANRELSRREDQLRQAEALAHLGSFEWEVSSNRLTWSDELYRINGLEPRAPINTTEALVRMHPEDQERMVATVEEAMARGQPFSLSIRIVRTDGVERQVQFRGRLQLDEAGQLIRIFGTCQDLTEQRQAEEARSRLASIVESSEDAIVGKTLEGTIESWNRGAERIFGYSAEEAIGQPMTILSQPEGDAELQRLFAQVRTGQRVAPIETVRRRKDGSVFDASVTFSPILDAGGRCIGISTITRDVTAYKKALAKFRAFVEAAPDAMVFVDRRGKVVLANSRTAQLFGYPPAELVGIAVEILAPERFRDLYLQHHNGFFGAPLSRPVREGFELFGLRKDGTEFPVEISLAPIDAEDGLLVSAAIRDITERKNIDAQLKDSLQQKEVLLREIHHRVKNNLQVIASLLNLQASVVAGEEARTGFLESQSRIQSMALVHQLLYQSKDLAQIDFGEYLRDLVGRLTQSYGANPEQITFSVGVPEVRLDIDTSVPCGLIVNELVTNTLKHAFPGGRRGRVEISLLREDPGGPLVLTVKDDGVGLPEGLRLDTVRTLGLQIVRTLTRQLRGTIEASTKGGTIFRISFSPRSPS